LQKGNVKARDAASKVISNQVDARQLETGPLYRQAFQAARDGGEIVDINPVISYIEGASNNYSEGGIVLPLLDRVKKIVGGADVDKKIVTVGQARVGESKNTLQRLHNAKVEIDEIMDQLEDGGKLTATLY